ncbi:MAG TPA: Fe-S protein assembly co-chaperone HscB [Chitinophagaceae bacterium]
MNFFELYNIPIQLNPDKAYIKQQYYLLSRQHHPDFFSSKSPEDQAANLEISSAVNKAFKTFQDQDAIIRYVLQLKELLEDEEKYQLDPEFLMEVMDINEELMDLDENDEVKVANIKTQVNELQAAIYKPVQPVIEGYVEGSTTTEALLQVKDYYYKKKYLQRILDKIDGMRNIAAH